MAISSRKKNTFKKKILCPTENAKASRLAKECSRGKKGKNKKKEEGKRALCLPRRHAATVRPPKSLEKKRKARRESIRFVCLLTREGTPRVRRKKGGSCDVSGDFFTFLRSLGGRLAEGGERKEREGSSCPLYLHRPGRKKGRGNHFHKARQDDVGFQKKGEGEVYKNSFLYFFTLYALPPMGEKGGERKRKNGLSVLFSKPFFLGGSTKEEADRGAYLVKKKRGK